MGPLNVVVCFLMAFWDAEVKDRLISIKIDPTSAYNDNINPDIAINCGRRIGTEIKTTKK